MKDRIMLLLKGVCMGLADIVPGVSGGTMALVLGIYTRFIHAIKSVDFRFVKPLLRAIRCGFRKEPRQELFDTLRAMDLPWLLTLVCGIATAFAIGSRVIPALMERYPTFMLAFFFGLVLASVPAPLRLSKKFGAQEILLVLVAALGAYLLVGGDSVEPPAHYRSVIAQDIEGGGQSLKSIAEAGPSARTPEAIFYDSENEELRTALPVHLARGTDPKAHDNPYNDLIVPAGTEVRISRPALWFIFVAGFVAICAMVLPGISGSFILLVLGSYYFMLNALKGFIKTAAHLQFPSTQLLFVGLFSLGALLGLVLFSRLLSWLLERYPSLTMATLMGIMVGCLRVIWPFKERVDDGTVQNIVMPNRILDIFGLGSVVVVVLLCLFGLSLVLGLGRLASRKESTESVAD